MRATVLLLVLAGDPAPAPLPVAVEGKGLAAEYPGDVGLAGDTRVVFVENFEDPEFRARWNEVKEPATKLARVEDRGGHVLEIVADLERDTGGHLYKMLAPGHDRLHLRFYVWFEPAHDYVHHFVNLMGYHPATRWPQGGAGERPDGAKRFSTGIEPWGDWGRVPPPGIWNFYSYWCQMAQSRDGKHWGNSFRPATDVPVARGRWICVEIMVKCNDPEKADGEQAFWIDGKCAGRWGGIRWRTTKALTVNGVCLSYYMTPNPARQNKVATPRRVNRVRFDDVVLATAYIGPKEPVR